MLSISRGYAEALSYLVPLNRRYPLVTDEGTPNLLANGHRVTSTSTMHLEKTKVNADHKISASSRVQAVPLCSDDEFGILTRVSKSFRHSEMVRPTVRLSCIAHMQGIDSLYLKERALT